MIRMVSEDSGRPGIAAVGVGGAGAAILSGLAETGMKGFGTISVAADAASLERSGAVERILIGGDITGGNGCGGDPELGRRAVLEDIDLVREALEEYDRVVLIAGLGGGTGTGALPEIASLAGEMGIRLLSVVTMPLSYEGRRRREMAGKGLASLRSAVEGVVPISNDYLLSHVDEETSMADAFFRRVNSSVCRVVQALVMLMEGGGLINAELSDIRSVLSADGVAAVGFGGGAGEGRALAAASGALSSAMLEKAPFNEAGGALVSFVGSPGMPFHDVDRALKRIAESAGAGADIVLGAFVDEAMEDRCTVTIIATGLGERPAPGKGAEAKEKAVTWEAEKVEQTVIDFSAPDRGRFADLEPSFYDGEDLDIPTILRRK
ncbi:MAG: hypothetical protein P9M00_10705 [Candidatus Tritonobacter lacicola]|nr:hypothetical protein [Candidatus Tritonobacter lacicola]